jgi:hypothetical protein
MNAHALPLQKFKYANPPRSARMACLRLRLRRRWPIDVRGEQRPAPDMTWALHRLAPRV